MYNCLTFTTVEAIEQPEKHLLRLASELNAAKVPWCLAFGSALGAYREKGFIPCDTDIDVMILADDIQESPIAIAARLFDDYNLARTVTYDGKFHQIAIQHADHFIIDLCFFYSDGDDWVSRCENGLWRDPKSVIGNFVNVETKYGSLPVPEKIEEYLEGRYGDWRTPRYGLQCCSIKETA